MKQFVIKLISALLITFILWVCFDAITYHPPEVDTTIQDAK